MPTEIKQLWAQYVAKPDRELLRVYADALVEGGDPRGTFLNLCLVDEPTPAQVAATQTMMAKQKKLLAGPGGAYLREFELGPDGLVTRARTEAKQVIAGIAELPTLSPRLVLTITSIKTLKDAVAFGQISLAPIYFVDFGWITGTHGGMNLSDKQLVAVAPALAGVRHLQLSARGGPDKCFSPDGLRALGPRLEALRYLSIDFYSVGLAAPEQYARAVADTFPQTLRAFDLGGLPLPGRPDVKTGTGLLDGWRPAPEVEQAFDQGRELADQLDAALA
ncbi:MAG: hypothetical protein WKG01_21870 [Kofleriaceae bacterium]